MIYAAGYFFLGTVVAWALIRAEQAVTSQKSLDNTFSFFMLAIMWPLALVILGPVFLSAVSLHKYVIRAYDRVFEAIKNFLT